MESRSSQSARPAFRKFTEPRLVIATHNAGKLREFQALLAGPALTLTSAGELFLPEPEETGDTFLANALIKAHATVKAARLPALADDSGLCVTALSGAPGIHSARWAGPDKNFFVAAQRLHAMLGDETDRSAKFVCALALVWPDGHEETVIAEAPGTLVWPPRGTQGHGYDPVFQPAGETRTFAEMDEAEKNCISHRALALAALQRRCFA